MYTRKRAIAMILMGALTLTLLLTACGSNSDNNPVENISPTPDISAQAGTDGASEPTPSITAPETASPEQPSNETSPATVSQGAEQSTEEGTVSAAGVTYYSGRCSFSLPDGLICGGTYRDDDLALYFTGWQDTTGDVGISDLQAITGRLIHIRENDVRVADFETRTAEEWYRYYYDFFNSFFGVEYNLGEMPENYIKRKTEQTTVDGHPAVRITWVQNSPVGESYGEMWAIDTPNSSIIIWLWNGYTSSYYEENTKWVADIINTIQIIDR